MTTGRNDFWTADRVSLLESLHHNGKSSREIAIIMGDGVTRNGVIGRLYRMGLSRPKHCNALAAVRKINKRTRLKRNGAAGFLKVPINDKPMPELVTLNDPPLSELVTLFDLKPHQCKFICHDGSYEDPRYCGRPRVSLKPYCPAHNARSYHQTERQRIRHASDGGFWLKAIGK